METAVTFQLVSDEKVKHPRYEVHLGGDTKFFLELHLPKNHGIAKQILRMIQEQRFLTQSDLTNQLMQLCKQGPCLITTHGPFMGPHDGFPERRMLRRAQSDSLINLPPGNLQTWIGYRKTSCDSHGNVSPSAERTPENHTHFCQRGRAESDVVREMQSGMRDALEKWLRGVPLEPLNAPSSH